jgi:uncharacterized membrane protein
MNSLVISKHLPLQDDYKKERDIMKISPRFKNVGLWVSVASSVLIILQTFGIHVSPDKYNAVTNSVLSILVVLGILSNPTTTNKFYGDDK